MHFKILSKLVNFCVAILILKMEENKQHFWHIILYFKKGKNATETQKKICAVYGEGAVSDQMYQKCFAKFHAGDFSLDNDPWLDRPVEVDSNQIETLIENNQHYTVWEITDKLKISKSKKLLVKMKNVSFVINGLFGQPNIYLHYIKYTLIAVFRKGIPFIKDKAQGLCHPICFNHKTESYIEQFTNIP